jgi:hypothetical protein
MKVVPLHVIEIQRGDRDVALSTLYIDLRKRWVDRIKPRLLYFQEKHPVHNVQETEWASDLSG